MRTNWLNKQPIYPILFGSFPALIAVASFGDEILPEQAFVPAAVGMLAAAILFLGALVIFRDKSRAAVVAAMAFLTLSSYDAFRTIPSLLLHTQLPNTVPLIFFVLVGTTALIPLAKLKDPGKYTAGLNICALLTVFIISGRIAAHETRNFLVYDPQCHRLGHEADAIAKSIRTSAKPDIYYIIVDAMASPDVLNHFYGYDNHDYLRFLQGHGFAVSTSSRSNYPMTVLSVASSLNMEYLDYLAPLLNSTSDRVVPMRLIQFSKVAQVLKRNGYQTINVSSGFGPTDWNPRSDVNVGSCFGSAFQVGLLQGTVCGAIQEHTDLIGGLPRNKRLTFFQNLEKIESVPGPKFVVAHIVMPHPPFLFDEQGAPVDTKSLSLGDGYAPVPYTQQVKFVEKRLEKAVEHLLAHKAAKPVIIIQSDHGPALTYASGTPTDEFLNERMHNFCACYIPNVTDSFNDSDKTKFLAHFNGVTPVNLFPVVLNTCFGTEIAMQPDRCIYAESAQPFLFSNVTDRVKPHWNQAAVVPVVSRSAEND